MEIEIRPIIEAEFPAYARAIDAAFSGAFSDEELENERRVAVYERSLAAFDGDAIVGGAASAPGTMTLPGASAAVGLVTAVGVQPTHRRRGINSALMQRQLDLMIELGEPLAALYASEGSIYGRYGYGMASTLHSVELETIRSAFLPGIPITGSVRLCTREQAEPHLRRIYDDATPMRPGMLAMTEERMAWLLSDLTRQKDEPAFFAVHDSDAGSPDAFSIYKVKHDWHEGWPRNELSVQMLVSSTSEGHAAIWRYLLDVDLVSVVRHWALPPDDALVHLVLDPSPMRFRLKHGLWLRLVDVATSLAARRYASDGRLVIAVADDVVPVNDGRWSLEVEAGEASCARSTSAPDLACGVKELGATFLGGISFRVLARAGRVRELTPGALARADAMFAWDPAPWGGYQF